MHFIKKVFPSPLTQLYIYIYIFFFFLLQWGKLIANTRGQDRKGEGQKTQQVCTHRQTQQCNKDIRGGYRILLRGGPGILQRRVAPSSPREAREKFSPSFSSCQDGLSWHLCGLHRKFQMCEDRCCIRMQRDVERL